MKFKDLVKLYEELKIKYEENAYRHISTLLQKAKDIHRRDFMQSNTAERAHKEGRTPDHEQSWRAFKGKNLEKLIKHILTDEVESLGLKIVEGNKYSYGNSLLMAVSSAGWGEE